MTFSRRVRRWAQTLAAMELGVYAANAAFFILLSLFPAVMLLIGLVQYTPLTPDDLQAALSELLPQALLPLLDYMIRELFAENSVALLSLSAVTALWMASKGAFSLLRGLNRVYGAKETRGWLPVRLRCLGLTLLLLLALLLTAALHLFGRHLTQSLELSQLPVLRLLGALLRMKYWLMTLLLSAFFAFVYLVLPNHRVSVTGVLPGAFCAAVGWEVFSTVFSYYVNRFGNYSLYYGSLSVIALTMLWLYGCLLILFFGALINKKRRRPAPSDNPSLSKPM